MLSVDARPQARVLLLVVELCSLTFRLQDRSKSNLVATALFGDGAAAAVVSCRGDYTDAPRLGLPHHPHGARRREMGDVQVRARQLGEQDVARNHDLLRGGRLVHTQVMSELRRKHRIRAQLTGPLPPVPASFNGHVTVATDAAGDLTIETPGELSGLLGWLATLPLAEVQIEPLGLRALYDQYHPF